MERPRTAPSVSLERFHSPCCKTANVPRLSIERETSTPVLLPASLVVLRAELFLFPVADGADAIRSDAPVHQSLFRRVGTIFAQRQVVLSRSAVIAISSDDDFQRG